MKFNKAKVITTAKNVAVLLAVASLAYLGPQFVHKYDVAHFKNYIMTNSGCQTVATDLRPHDSRSERIFSEVMQCPDGTFVFLPK